jgi:hypothetical protein
MYYSNIRLMERAGSKYYGFTWFAVPALRKQEITEQ